MEHVAHFMESVHVELADERRYIRVFKIGPAGG
jgi:hypothetical protein